MISGEVSAYLKEKYGSYEIPKKYLFVTEPFTLENGMLTQTMKVKRRIITEKYKSQLMGLYEARLIVGVALAGPEPGYPVKPFQKIMARFHEAGLGIEIHAGEWCGPESVWDALEHGYPDRLGHGVSAFRDARLIEALRERGIHIELCPTSNRKTGSIANIAEHPIRQARDLEMSFSVNTDDPGAFESSLDAEVALVSDVFGFSEQDWLDVFSNSLRARFQPNLRIDGSTLPKMTGV